MKTIRKAVSPPSVIGRRSGRGLRGAALELHLKSSLVTVWCRGGLRERPRAVRVQPLAGHREEVLLGAPNPVPDTCRCGSSNAAPRFRSHDDMTGAKVFRVTAAVAARRIFV